METREVVMEEMVCMCGEALRGELGKGQIWEQWENHLKRPDHQASPAQWKTAYDRIAEWKEKAKKQQ